MSSATQWTVPVDHPVFAGHFPGTPIVPGVMLLDAAMHSIAAATAIGLDRCEIGAVKFFSPARPGEILTIAHSRAVRGAIRFDIVARTRKIASGSIVPRLPR